MSHALFFPFRLAAILVAFGLVCTADAKDSDVKESQGPSLPQPLGLDDKSRYQRIFALQKDGHWRRADIEIARSAAP